MNPYKILKVDSNATSRDIIQSGTQAMRERNFSAREIAMAQKELMNPVTRRVHYFLNFIDVAPLTDRQSKAPTIKKSASVLELLTIFD